MTGFILICLVLRREGKEKNACIDHPLMLRADLISIPHANVFNSQYSAYKSPLWLRRLTELGHQVTSPS